MMKYCTIIIGCLLLHTELAAQQPGMVVRRVAAADTTPKPGAVIRRLPTNTNAQPGTVVRRVPANEAPANLEVTTLARDAFFLDRSKLLFFQKIVVPECKGEGCVYDEVSYQKQFTYLVNSAFASTHNWEHQVLWKNFPPGTGVTASGGGFNLKPHPAGQFQTAYVVLEITRTGNKSKQRYPVKLGYSDKATASAVAYNSKTGEKKDITVSSNLFEDAGTDIPFLENVGEKTTVYIFLRPAINYYNFDKETNAMKSITNSPPWGWYTPHSNEDYERGAGQAEFQHLSKPGSTLTIYLGLKKAEWVNTVVVQ